MNSNSFDIRRLAPPITLNLIIINFLVWIAQLALPRIGIDLTGLLGLHYFEASSFRLHQLATYMFLHSEQSIEHVFFNMFSVWMFGSTIERYWGARRYLIFYVVTGISAALMQEVVWYYELHSYVQHSAEMIQLVAPYGQVEVVAIGQWLAQFTTIGASGAVFGLLLAFGMLFPNARMFLLFVPIPIKAKYFVIGYGLIELFLGVHPSMGDSVAHFAHLGGMIGGIILILLWRKKGIIGGPYY